MPTRAGRMPVALATMAFSTCILVPSAAALAIHGLMPAALANAACVSGVAYRFRTPLQLPATTGVKPSPTA